MKAKSLLVVFLLLAATAAWASIERTLPEGTDIKVRTDTAIPAQPAQGAVYSATVSDDVMDQSGAVAIPKGSRAQLVAVPSPDGKDITLDLRSVTVGSQKYSITAPGSANTARPGGLGANTRTAKYVGGGAAVGAVLGALLGGGKGAAIGALLGGAGGAGAQVYTNKGRQIPPETTLSYKTAQPLQLQPAPARSSGLQNRTK